MGFFYICHTKIFSFTILLRNCNPSLFVQIYLDCKRSKLLFTHLILKKVETYKISLRKQTHFSSFKSNPQSNLFTFRVSGGTFLFCRPSFWCYREKLTSALLLMPSHYTATGSLECRTHWNHVRKMTHLFSATVEERRQVYFSWHSMFFK